jgi:hypothetical protein
MAIYLSCARSGKRLVKVAITRPQWIELVGSIYVSERRSGDPALYRIIVTSKSGRSGPSYLIHAPTSVDGWIAPRKPAPEFVS